MDEILEKLRYPIGQFAMPDDVSAEQIQSWIGQIEALPRLFADAVKGLTDEQLNSSYRPGGWTIRQVAHHMADAHMNYYIRFKLALTEDVPAIKPFEEGLWSELEDARTLPPEVSIQLLASLCQRWAALLRSLSPADFRCEFRHPVSGQMNLEKALALCTWHGNHHLAHILSYRKSQGL